MTTAVEEFCRACTRFRAAMHELGVKPLIILTEAEHVQLVHALDEDETLLSAIVTRKREIKRVGKRNVVRFMKIDDLEFGIVDDI